jgi:hypothetical protein
MSQVAMVHAAADAALARELGSYLQRNCRVEIDYSFLVAPANPVLDVVGRALSSDVLILLLSAASIPRALERSRWEPLFADAAAEHGTRIVYVKVAECPFPKVLLRSNTFDPTGNPIECARAMKRWFFEHDPPAQRSSFVPSVPDGADSAEVERLLLTLGDAPGAADTPDMATARALTAQAQRDFEGVFWIEARGATLAGVLGELGVQLGLRLTGEEHSNLEAIHRICEKYRCLVVLSGPSPDVADRLRTLGRCSVLFAPAAPSNPLSVQTARERLQALSNWLSRPNAVPPSGDIRETLLFVAGHPQHWTLACDFARSATAHLRFNDRLAEAFEITEMMTAYAIARQDPRAASEFGRERAWILEAWGRKPEAIYPFAEPAVRPVQTSFW